MQQIEAHVRKGGWKLDSNQYVLGPMSVMDFVSLKSVETFGDKFILL